MTYKPNGIWDVLDEHGNKTGRYTERGRKMATGDYHLSFIYGSTTTRANG